VSATLTSSRSFSTVISSTSAPRRDQWAFPCVVVLILALTAFRLAYLAFWCPYDLATDEAHYWDWSRHLDWSYYSKGPLVAWLIRLSCSLFGETVLAVRLPAVLCGSLAMVGLYCLTVLAYRRPWLGFGVVALASSIPVVAVGSLLMTIDAPFLCCWTWALVAAHRAVIGQRVWAWPVLGLLVALGLLAKYNMAVFPASLALFLLWFPSHRNELRRRGFWLMASASLLGAVPILIWNAQQNWVSFRHVMGQAGVEGTSAWRWWGVFDYLGGQAALLLGLWFILWLGVMVKIGLGILRKDKQPPTNEAFLWCMSAPIFLVFLAFSFRTKIQLNWPLAAYVGSLPLVAAWGWRYWESGSNREKKLLGAGLCLFLPLGLGATILLHFPEAVHASLATMAIGQRDSINLRKLDPTCRLRGWRELAVEVERTRKELRAEGIEPVLATTYWNLPGEIGFYLPDHPEVYCIGRAGGSRWSQYDLWRPNPIADAEQFKGKTFILVGYLTPTMLAAFDHMSQTMVEHRVHGFLVASWPVTVARGFKGFGTLPESSH
jgi:4-amino-4-deoxy-L-arabinose transferase-like glycosyltransferase